MAKGNKAKVNQMQGTPAHTETIRTIKYQSESAEPFTPIQQVNSIGIKKFDIVEITDTHSEFNGRRARVYEVGACEPKYTVDIIGDKIKKRVKVSNVKKVN